MKRHVSVGIFVLFFVLVVLYTIFVGPPWKGTSASDLLDVSSMLVSVATITSVVFGMIIYLESNVLQGRIDVLQKKLEENESRMTQAIAETARKGKKANFDVAHTGIKALWDIVYTLSVEEDDDEALKRRSKYISLQEARLHLAFGSPSSVESAMQILFKTNARELLQSESRVLELSREWNDEERRRILEQFQHLKCRLLDTFIQVE